MSLDEMLKSAYHPLRQAVIPGKSSKLVIFVTGSLVLMHANLKMYNSLLHQYNFSKVR